MSIDRHSNWLSKSGINHRELQAKSEKLLVSVGSQTYEPAREKLKNRLDDDSLGRKTPMRASATVLLASVVRNQRITHTSILRRGSLRGNVEDFERGSPKRFDWLCRFSVSDSGPFWTSRIGYATKIPSNRRCHPYGWPTLGHYRILEKMRRGHGEVHPSRQNLCDRSPGGGSRDFVSLARYRRHNDQAMPAKGWAKCAVAPGCRAQSKAACENPIHLRTWYE